MSPERSEGVFDAWVGGRLSEGIGRASLCRANDRADKRLGADAKQRHRAWRCLPHEVKESSTCEWVEDRAKTWACRYMQPNDRAVKRLGIDAKQRHEAYRDEKYPILFLRGPGRTEHGIGWSERSRAKRRSRGDGTEPPCAKRCALRRCVAQYALERSNVLTARKQSGAL